MVKKLIMVVLLAVCLPVVAADVSAPGLVPVEISAGVQVVGDVNKQIATNKTGMFAGHRGGGLVALGTLSGGIGDAGVVLGVFDSYHNRAGRSNRHSRSPGVYVSLSNRVGFDEYRASAPFETG